MEDGNFWHLGGVTRWNSQFLKSTWTFLAIICVASQLFLCFFWISLWVKNMCLQHPCFENLCKIAQASKNSDSNAQQFLSDLLTHSWFHSMLFALPGYQFPYTVMNRCLYLKNNVSYIIHFQTLVHLRPTINCTQSHSSRLKPTKETQAHKLKSANVPLFPNLEWAANLGFYISHVASLRVPESSGI
jgi:hypothetical protein